MSKWQEAVRGIQTLDAHDVDSFFAHLNRTGDEWGWDGKLQRRAWIFRGHPNAEWSLLPSAWRTVGRSPAMSAAVDWAKELLPLDLEVQQLEHTGTMPFPPRVDLDAARTVVIQANAELALISDFLCRADSLGHHIPGPMPPEFHAGRLFEANRPISADDFLDLQFSDQQAALAQHHGVPTRLMDWTDDPLIAAFFAASGPSLGSRVAVWALNEPISQRLQVQTWAEVGWKLRVLRPPRAPNPFLRAQLGVFTACYGAGLYALVHEGAFPSLEELAGSAPSGEVVLRKVTLPASCVEEALDWLERHYISRSSLMPSLDNISQDVTARWRGPSGSQKGCTE